MNTEITAYPTLFKKVLKENGLTQKELYGRIKALYPDNPVAIDAISQIFSGVRVDYSLFTLIRICHGLKCTPNDVISMYWMPREQEIREITANLYASAEDLPPEYRRAVAVVEPEKQEADLPIPEPIPEPNLEPPFTELELELHQGLEREYYGDGIETELPSAEDIELEIENEHIHHEKDTKQVNR